MEFAASTLGIQLPLLSSARKAVMKSFQSRHEPDSWVFCHHKDSLLCIKLDHCKDDDETASMISSDGSLSSSTGPSVTFADQLVSNVYSRPKTLREEKRALFYCDADYRFFRKDFLLNGNRESRESVVKFKEEIVSDVHVYQCEVDSSSLYYSESDLKRFLDEFVASLNENWCP
jgi:hypothetical protein